MKILNRYISAIFFFGIMSATKGILPYIKIKRSEDNGRRA
jgi:hypothetical protein